MRKSRFLWSHFFTHPGTWVGLALFIIGLGIFLSFMAPLILHAIAPTLLLAAGVATLFAVVSLPFYIARYIDRLRVERKDIENKNKGAQGYTQEHSLFDIMLKHFGNWVTNHSLQALFVTAGIAAFALALWITITFFTGGSTLLIAPVFAAIAAPFVANSTIGLASLPLVLAIMSGAIFTIAPLFLTNVAKRFLALFGSSDKPTKDDHEQSLDDKKDSNRDSLRFISERGQPQLPEVSNPPRGIFYLTHFSGRNPDEIKVSGTSTSNNPFDLK